MNSTLNFLGKRSFSLYNYTHHTNPKIFLTLSKNGENLGDLVFELYQDKVPKHAENVIAFATGSNASKQTYVGTKFSSGATGILMQGGRVDADNLSADGTRMPDAAVLLRHYKRGMLTMANDGENSNGSEFMITLDKADMLDGYHTVVGELV
jgi:peptidylprolyl isomerase